LVLLVPYIGWGIYTLRLRYVYREELETLWEGCTLAAVGLFCGVEILLLRSLAGDSVTYYLFAVLGIFTATAALYGPMLVSLAAHMTVEMIHPDRPHDDQQPDFGPAEALEEMGDWEGALKEYTVFARIFPKNPEPVLKMADMLVELAKPESAARMFERGLFLLNDEDREWRIINRLAGIYENQLDNPGEAIRVLGIHVDFYPESEIVVTIEQRIERLRGKSCQEPGRSESDLVEPPPGDLWE
jgi:tetratricopeptide (TPR) repeat protein